MVVEGYWADLVVAGDGFEAWCSWRSGVVVVEGLWADLIIIGGGSDARCTL